MRDDEAVGQDTFREQPAAVQDVTRAARNTASGVDDGEPQHAGQGVRENLWFEKGSIRRFDCVSPLPGGSPSGGSGNGREERAGTPGNGLDIVR